MRRSDDEVGYVQALLVFLLGGTLASVGVYALVAVAVVMGRP